MARVLVVEDDPSQRKAIVELLCAEHEVQDAADAGMALRILRATEFDLLIVDLVLRDHDGWWLTDRARETDRTLSVVMVSDRVDCDVVERAMAAGAVDLLRAEAVKGSDAQRFQRAVGRALARTAVLRRAEAAAAETERQVRCQEMLLGTSAQVKSILAQVERYRDADTTILVEGPTGAGKELVARTLHANSPFAGGPFVAVCLPFVSAETVASELFGHVRGALPGAERDTMGAFEQAHGGTLFLDEIGELDLGLQERVLQAIETKLISRVGSERTIPVRTRIIAATKRSLASMMKAGKLRPDLFHRLSRCRIEVPPLRERREDIPVLAKHFLSQQLRKLGRTMPSTIDEEALETLAQYSWPGNVRELETVLDRVVLGPVGETVTASCVLRALGPLPQGFGQTRAPAKPPKREGTKRRLPAVKRAGERACRARILFVDDEPVVCRSFARLLRQDYDVTLAQGGAEALGLLLQAQDYDLVLCDLVMPDIGGIEVYRRLREKKPGAAKRFVFVSGAVNPDAFRSLAPGIDMPIVSKPLLFAQVRELLSIMTGKATRD